MGQINECGMNKDLYSLTNLLPLEEEPVPMKIGRVGIKG
jgi:hypothetical protein